MDSIDRATRCSLRNLFQSLFFVEKRTSVMIWMTPIARMAHSDQEGNRS
jgi:hypothetical protein